MEPKEVIFDAVLFRPNYAVKSFYYNPQTFERVDANRAFYAGDVVHVTEVFGNESDPGGLVWEIQFRNSEGILGRVCIQPMANDWGRKANQVVPTVIAPNLETEPRLTLDPIKYMNWLFVTKELGIELWPEMGKGTSPITILNQGFPLKQINQPDWAEVEWAGHTAFVEMKYVAPVLQTGKYYMQLTEIDWDPMQDPAFHKPDPEPEPQPSKWWERLALWLQDHGLEWLAAIIVWLFDR